MRIHFLMAMKLQAGVICSHRFLILVLIESHTFRLLIPLTEEGILILRMRA